MKLFKTFFIGGYECADMINNRGNRVNLLTDTGHDQHIDEDYRTLAELGIKTVREGIVWSTVEAVPYQYNFTEVRNRLIAAQKWGIQQIWDICHFGYPDNLMPGHPQFADRFAGTCRAFAELYRHHTDDPLIVTPVNEISFLSWLGGDVRGTVPFAIHSGPDVKYHLCRAAIRGIEAIRSVDGAAKILCVEPLIRIHPIPDDPDFEQILRYNEGQFEAMDMITGRMHPELGGKPEYMDIAGFNYYYENQWRHKGHTLDWHPGKREADGATPLYELLQDAYQRYGKPVMLSETGHFKEERPLWMETVTDDCIRAIQNGVDLQGICIYPVLDRPDWDQMDHVIACGIWGYHPDRTRYVEQEYYNTVAACIRRMDVFRNEHQPALSAVALG